MYRIIVGDWRDDSTGPLQVVSGPLGRERIHYQAPPAAILDKQMGYFLKWLNDKKQIDLVLKAALAHLWFVTLHPFEDGNGRIARALTDMILAQSDNQSTRFYSMSAQIRNERKQYYDILEKTQKGGLDVTDWIEWFLNCLLNSLTSSETILGRVIIKHHFWIKNAGRLENDRQKKVLNMLLDGFDGKLTTSKWARIGKCSQDTALRDIQDLLDKQILIKLPGGGRSTAYDLKH
jgi:Fic family protein